MKDEKVIGIVGGMGPEAGLGLFRHILAHTPARTDQDHLPVVLMSFPGQLADRTAFLEGKHVMNPAYMVADIIGRLEHAGAGVAAIACNTCHAPAIFHVIENELASAGRNIKLLNIVDESCRHLREQYPQLKRIGIMTTNGTYRSGVYSDLLAQWGYEVVVPDPVFQNDIIHRMIYDPRFGVKAIPNRITTQTSALMNRALRYFVRERAEAVILGCTELSLLTLRETENHLLIIDSTEILARALIREARTCIRENSTI
jgi:aspartate racemase